MDSAGVLAGRTPFRLGMFVSVAAHVIALLLLSRIMLVPVMPKSEPMEVFLWHEPSVRGEKVERSESVESTVQTAEEVPAKGGTPGRAGQTEIVSDQAGAEVETPEVSGEDIIRRKQQIIAEEKNRRAQWQKSWRTESGLPDGNVAGVGGLPQEPEARRAVMGKVMGIQGPVGERKIVFSQLPTYPAWAKQQGIEGDVLLKFWVSPEGLVSNVEILRFSGFRDFDERAARSLRNWRFEPLAMDEARVEQWGTVPFKFRLEKTAY